MLIRKTAQFPKTNGKESSAAETIENISSNKTACETKENNELEANIQISSVVHCDSSNDCIIIEDDDDSDDDSDEDSMVVTDPAQNNNEFFSNVKRECSPAEPRPATVSVPAVTEPTTPNLLTNDNLNNIPNNSGIHEIETETELTPPPESQPPSQSQPQTQPQVPSLPPKLTNNGKTEKRSGLFTSLPLSCFRRDYIPSTTLVLDKATSTNKSNSNIINEQLLSNEENLNEKTKTVEQGASAKLANELLKRLQESDSLTLSFKFRTNIVHSLPPTRLHRLSNLRDLKSVDSLIREMCHFKPIITSPITPQKRSNAIIIKIPVPKIISPSTENCNFLIGPKEGMMPVLFSTTTSDRFSAFCLYEKKHVICKPLLTKFNTLEPTLVHQRFTRNVLFKHKCIVRLERCKIPPIILQQYISNVLPLSKFKSKSNISNKDNDKNQKPNLPDNNIINSVDCRSKYEPSTSKDLFPINIVNKECESIRQHAINMNFFNKYNEENIATTSNSSPFSSACSSSNDTTTTSTSVVKNFKKSQKATSGGIRLKKKQERLDFEYAKKLQEKYQTEYSLNEPEPIAKRLRKCI